MKNISGWYRGCTMPYDYYGSSVTFIQKKKRMLLQGWATDARGKLLTLLLDQC